MKITESKLRRIIRNVIAETHQLREMSSAENILSQLGIKDEESFLDTVLSESFLMHNLYEFNVVAHNKKIDNRREIDSKVKQKMEEMDDITYELDESYNNLSEEKRQEFDAIVSEIAARKSLASMMKIKRLITLLGSTLAVAPILIMLFGSAFGIDTAYLADTYPLIFSWAGGGLGASGIALLTGGFGAAGDSYYHEDKIDYNQGEIERLQKKARNIRYT